jgi:hypothetical protein
MRGQYLSQLFDIISRSSAATMCAYLSLAFPSFLVTANPSEGEGEAQAHAGENAFAVWPVAQQLARECWPSRKNVSLFFVEKKRKKKEMKARSCPRSVLKRRDSSRRRCNCERWVPYVPPSADEMAEPNDGWTWPPAFGCNSTLIATEPGRVSDCACLTSSPAQRGHMTHAAPVSCPHRRPRAPDAGLRARALPKTRSS